jgi:hypothetical protein
MKAVATFIALLCLAANSALAGDKAETLTFKQAGFSIAPLDEPQKGPSQTLIMFLPASDGFAPNVNVQIQPYSGSIDAYADLSKTQFKQVGFKLLSENKSGKAEITFEYSGTLQGRNFHWYARAIQNGGIIYLVTATATEEQWSKVADKLKVCVNSFETIK